MFQFGNFAGQAGPVRIDLQAHTRLMQALMDRIECGVLACGPQGELFHANVAAHQELECGRFLRVVEGGLRPAATSQCTWNQALHDATARARSRLINLEDGVERLQVALVPVRVDGLDAAAAVAIMGRRSVCSPLGLEMLAASHGLTYAESRVFRALVGNLSAREIAASHGVAMATVRTQIQSVRDKLGVRSIDALLLRAAELPPVTARF